MVVVVVVGAVDMVEVEAAEDMVVEVVVAAVVEHMVEVEEISLLMAEAAMVVGALYPPMVLEVAEVVEVVEEGEEEIPLPHMVVEEEVEDLSPHMVEVEAHKPLTAEEAA